MQGFGEPPAYSTYPVLAAAALCVFGGIAHGLLSVFDLNFGWAPGTLMLALSAALFLFGLVLLIRFVEARDAMTDPSPRTRLYDSRHERAAYLAGLIVTLLSLLADGCLTAATPGGAWHLLPAVLTLAAAWLFGRLWARRSA